MDRGERGVDVQCVVFYSLQKPENGQGQPVVLQPLPGTSR